MAELLKWFSDVSNSITGKLNLGEDGTFAIAIGLIIIGIAISLSAFRILKKVAGKTIASIALVALLISTGFLSTAQMASFAEKIGVIKESSVGEGLEVNGQAFIDWIEEKMPGAEDDEKIGSWVPNKNEQGAGDWHE